MENPDSNWQDLRPRERMEYLLKTGHLSDCSFVVYDDDGQKIVLKCHKFVLMNVSPVFERMFEGDFEEAKIPENIVLDDVSASDFKKFIEYLYWHDDRRLDICELPTLQTLIYLSKKFLISFMTINCLNVIKRRLAAGLEADVIVDLYEYAHQIEDNELVTSVRSKFMNHASVYINTAAVFDLSSDIFLKFIDEFACCIGDKQRFDVIDRYCRIHGLVVNAANLEKQDVSADQEGSKIAEPKKPIVAEPIKEVGVAVETPKLEGESVEDKPKEEIQKIADDKDENENYLKKGKMGVFGQAKEPDPEEQKKKYERELKWKEKYVRKLLKTINFTSMTAYDFCAGPGASNLLTVENKYKILSAICINGHKMRLFSARLT